jgi:hypothetical protein
LPSRTADAISERGWGRGAAVDQVPASTAGDGLAGRGEDVAGAAVAVAAADRDSAGLAQAIAETATTTSATRIRIVVTRYTCRSEAVHRRCARTTQSRP